MSTYLNETILPISPDSIGTFHPIPPKKDNKIAIVFDNFLRDDLMFNLVKSIFIYSPGVKLYISDQSVFNPITDIMYNKLREAGHEIIYCGFDCGISVARNRAIKRVKEPYIFLSDCDLLFTKNTNLSKMIEILNNNNDIGFLSLYEYNQDKVNYYEIMFDKKDDVLNYAYITEQDEIRNNEFFYCDYCMNTGMIRKEFSNKVQYDEQMKLAEHLDYFMQIKYNSNWKVACATKISIRNQNIDIQNENYNQFRRRNKIYWKLYNKKWNLTLINKYNILIDKYTNIQEVKTVLPNTNNIVSLQQSVPVSTSIAEFLLLMNKLNIPICLLKETCLNIILNHVLPTNNIQIGTSLEHMYEVQEYAIKNNLNIEVSNYNFEKTKPYTFNEIKLYVPKPVVKYLEDYTGKSWKELTNAS